MSLEDGKLCAHCLYGINLDDCRRIMCVNKKSIYNRNIKLPWDCCDTPSWKEIKEKKKE